jgi:hypothetical protein
MSRAAARRAVTAARMAITHIASDGEVLFEAAPVLPRSAAQKPGAPPPAAISTLQCWHELNIDMESS